MQPPVRRPDHQLAYVRQFLDCGERDQPPQVVPLGVGKDRPAVIFGMRVSALYWVRSFASATSQ
ncbi:hypothetical protein [Streptomyces osmaniensis]|uniref:hypothetical protein n=1 Tax=Streptomyces osmaniensis TaxID=593134 RepID=UPI001C327674|nr:hypothetical protein KJK32_05075 [Streptomyces sp. JCM17656]